MACLGLRAAADMMHCVCCDSHDFIGSCQTTLKQLTMGEIRDFEASSLIFFKLSPVAVLVY